MSRGGGGGTEGKEGGVGGGRKEMWAGENVGVLGVSRGWVSASKPCLTQRGLPAPDPLTLSR